MKDIREIYNINYINNNIIYSLDMLRLKTYIDYNTWYNIEHYIEFFYKDNITFYKIGRSIKEFHYNYNIEVEEGKSIYIGFQHNNERVDDHGGKYNLTIEFNPNKVKDHKFIYHLLDYSGEWYIKSYDIAIDLRVSILDLIYDTNKRLEKVDNRGYTNKTIAIGKGDGRIKIYNKKIESDLNITGELTRIEISRQMEDFPIKNIKLFKYDDNFPYICTNNYVYSLSDYKDKTLLALVYAVQNGFPLKELTKTYRKKIKDMFSGGYQIKFSNKLATQVLSQTIYFYFMKNKNPIHWR